MYRALDIDARHLPAPRLIGEHVDKHCIGSMRASLNLARSIQYRTLSEYIEESGFRLHVRTGQPSDVARADSGGNREV